MLTMTRIAQRTAGTYVLSVATTDEEGASQVVVTATSATLTDGAGAVVASATGDDLVVLDEGVGIQWAVPVATMPLLDTYTVTWTGVVASSTFGWTTLVELAGGHLFTVAQLRARDRAYEDTEKFPDARICEVRCEVEDTIEGEDAAAVAFVPRGRRATLDGHGRAGLTVPDLEVREVYAVTIDGAAVDPAVVAAIIVDDGVLWMPPGRSWPAGRQNITVHYAHGRDCPPAPIRRAALTLARDYLAPGDLPGRASSTTVGDQTFRLTIAGRDGVTGLPEVDAAITQHGRTRYRIG